MNFIGQIIGFIFLGIAVYSFQFKEKEKLMRYRILSRILASIHYILIGAYAGFISQFIETFANLFAYKLENTKQTNKVVMTFFIILFILFGIIIYQDIYDILPIIVAVVTTIIIYTKGTDSIRTSQFFLVPLFFIYNIVNLSYAGMITDVLVIISCTLGKIKFDNKKRV